MFFLQLSGKQRVRERCIYYLTFRGPFLLLFKTNAPRRFSAHTPATAAEAGTPAQVSHTLISGTCPRLARLPTSPQHPSSVCPPSPGDPTGSCAPTRPPSQPHPGSPQPFRALPSDATPRPLRVRGPASEALLGDGASSRPPRSLSRPRGPAFPAPPGPARRAAVAQR